MKLLNCHIYRFGELEEKKLDFGDKINLIYGRNESGKSTLHTALAALLFGMERGHGRAAQSDTYHSYLPWKGGDVYGGDLTVERGGVQYRLTRDFSVTPHKARCIRSDQEKSREIPAADFPLPPYLTPATYYNTLSFKQPGAAATGELAGILKEHIQNMAGGGSESLNVSEALARLKAQKKQREKETDPAAEERAEAIDAELSRLETEDITEQSEELDRLMDDRDIREKKLKELTVRQNDLSSALTEKSAVAQKLGISEKDQITKDIELAKALKASFSTYEEFYAQGPHFGLIGGSILGALLAFAFLAAFWFCNILMQQNRYIYALPCFLLAIVFAVFAIRQLRRQDAEAARRKNAELLRSCMSLYLADMETEIRGLSSEADTLLNYLERLQSFFAEEESLLAEKAALEQKIFTINSADSVPTFRLDELMLNRGRREVWEERIRELETARDALEPALAKNRRLREEIAAIDLAVSTLTRLSEDVACDFGQPLAETASEIFREITSGSYEGLRIASDLTLTALKNHRDVPLTQLSRGTLEQIWFSFRMAVIRLLWPNEEMPLFLDDSFVLYDRERLRLTLRWLAGHYNGQIFLFTCQEREEAILRGCGISYRRLPLSPLAAALSADFSVIEK